MKRLANLAQSGIAIYKYKKYRRQFTVRPNIQELKLMSEWFYFLTLPAVKVIYDIGAAEGVFSSGCSKIANVQQIVALEPNPDMAPALNKLTHRASHCTYVPVAAGRAMGSHLFHVTADGHASSCLTALPFLNQIFLGRNVKKSISIQMQTLDEIRSSANLPYADLIKIDTQGYEREVISGASNTLSHASFCIVECCYEKLYEDAPLISDIFSIFSVLGWAIVGTGPSLKAVSGRPVFTDLIFASKRGLQAMK
jgi:FkbM family methyltransferase